MGVSVLDSLDTLLLMNLTEQFKRARDWAVRRLDLDRIPQPTSVRLCPGAGWIGGWVGGWVGSGGKDASRSLSSVRSAPKGCGKGMRRGSLASQRPWRVCVGAVRGVR